MSSRSSEINELAAALAKAQLKISGAAKDSTNPHFKSSYADLASVWEACHTALNENGIAIVQTLDTAGQTDPPTLFLYTPLLHSSGQWISSEYRVQPMQNTPQGVGSALTYARRYSLMAIAGVAAYDDDDDGNAASIPQNMGQMPREPSRARAQQSAVNSQLPPKGATEAQQRQGVAPAQQTRQTTWDPPPDVIETIPLGLCKGPFSVLAEFDGIPLQNLYAPDLELIVSTIAEHRPIVRDPNVQKWFLAIEATATVMLRNAQAARPGDQQ